MHRAQRIIVANEQTAPIIVGVDFSDQSNEALRQASDWATRSGRSLVACHALAEVGALQPVLHLLGLDRDVTERAMRVATDRLEQRVKLITGRSLEPQQLIVELGSPHAVLLKQAHEFGAALLVLAATGKGALERALLGSTAEQVVRHARAPVLVARSSPDSGLVMVASDLSDTGKPAVEAAVAEVKQRAGRLVAAHCLELPSRVLATFEPSVIIDETTLKVLREAAHESLAATVAAAGGEGDTAVLEGSPATAIVEAAARADAELLIAGTHGHGAIALIALGSVAARLVRNAPCSVLVVHRKK